MMTALPARAEFKTPPFKHQAHWLEATRDAQVHALLWEQGTGKTWLILETAAHLYRTHVINAVLVIAPSGVHRTWLEDELPAHLADDVARASRLMAWRSDRAGSQRWARAEASLLKHEGLSWLTMNYEAVITARGKLLVQRFLHQRRVLMVLDEAHHVKTPSAKRSRVLINLGRRAHVRRVLTGTPVANSPLDLYAQLRFLDEGFWRREGMSTFAAFKHRYCILETRRFGDGPIFNQVVGFRRLEELHAYLAGVSSRVLKEDALDLPPKLYQKRYVTLTQEQRRVYDELRDELTVLLDSGERITAPQAIVNLLRLQQVICGYVPVDENRELVEIVGPNPRIEELVDVVNEAAGQVIVWARFRADVDRIVAALSSVNVTVRYDGAVGSDDRREAIRAFQAGEARFFVGNPAAAGEGLTLHAATTVIYYSNSFKLTERLQSEDRAHRIGQARAVTYVDLIAEDTVDERIVTALRTKRNIAAEVTGDQLREWL
jgi:SNF2 family DNA or RNA helicase